MECCGRRSRRGRGRCNASNLFDHKENSTRKSYSNYLNGFFTIFILSSLIALMYLMLEYHCSVCKAKCELGNITKSIEDLSANFVKMNAGYQELENKVTQFSEELPKLQTQMDALEALANSVKRPCFSCRPKCAPIPKMETMFGPQLEKTLMKKLNNSGGNGNNDDDYWHLT